MIDVQDLSVYDLISQNIPAQEQVVSKKVQNDTFLVAVQNVKKPTVVAPDTTKISPVVNYMIQELRTGTPQKQTENIYLINKALNSNAAVQFLDENITNALFDVVNKDTSKLKKPTSKQIKLRKKIEKGENISSEQVKTALTLSDSETAERNKVYALATIAKIQNLLYKEITKRTGLKPKFYDMPAAAKLVEEYKNNADKNIQKASLEAIYIMYKPEFRNDILPIFEQAVTSQNQEISLLAQDVLHVIKTK